MQNLAEKFSSQFPTALYATAFAYLTQQSGVQILSKFSPHFYCAGAEVEPWIRIPKVGEAMTFPLTNGQALLVVNVHLINFEINLDAYRQQLSRLMSLVNRHHGPIVLAVMDLTKGIIQHAAVSVNGDGPVNYQGTEIKINEPFKRVHMVDAIKEITGVDFWQDMSFEEAAALAKEKKVPLEKHFTDRKSNV